MGDYIVIIRRWNSRLPLFMAYAIFWHPWLLVGDTDGIRAGRGPQPSMAFGRYRHPWLQRPTAILGFWAHQDLNLGPTDYESAALTN